MISGDAKHNDTHTHTQCENKCQQARHRFELAKNYCSQMASSKIAYTQHTHLMCIQFHHNGNLPSVKNPPSLTLLTIWWDERLSHQC